MPKLYNLARMTTATTGTGTITLGVAVSGYLTFANAGVANSDIVFYGIKDSANSEVGWGTYTSSGTTLTRNVVKSTNANAAISLSGSAEVYITSVAGDGGDLLPGFDHPMRGFDLPLNLQLNASVASNVLTVAVKGNNGSDPSNSNPVLIPFRDPTVANGGPVWRAITGALAINTVAAGASLGAANSVPFRLWVVAFDNAATVVLGLWQSVTGGASVTAIGALNEAAVASSTAMSSTSNVAATFYTQSAVTSRSFRMLGYLDFAGQTTAGSYAAAPTTIALFGPGIRRPGDIVGLGSAANTGTQSTSSATYAAMSGGLTLSYTPTMAPNVVKVTATSQMSGPIGGTNDLSTRIFNNTTSVQVGYSISTQQVQANIWIPFSTYGYDRPGSTSAQSYIMQAQINGGATLTMGNGFGAGAVFMDAQEIMV